MRRLCAWSALVLLLFAPGCLNDTLQPQPAAPVSMSTSIVRPDIGQVSRALVEQAGWPVETEGTESQKAADPAASCLVQPWQRQVIHGDVVHYSTIVKTGPGVYDQLGIHRVVKESRTGLPIRTHRTVFLQHGASKSFVGMFLPGLNSSSMADDFGLAAFLGDAGFDVWGIDQAWNLVPEEVTDFTFMRDWGVQRNVDDLGYAIALARTARLLTGNAWDAMPLLGYSFGAELGYSLLNQETQLPRGLRQVKAFIPVDFAIRTNDPAFQQFFCDYGVYARDRYDNGLYNDDSLMRPMGKLARDDPSGDSPVIPGLSNLQAAIYLGSGAFWSTMTMHYVAGVFDAGVPVGLQYVSNDAWVDFLATAAAHEPVHVSIDQAGQFCGDVDVPWDDNLSQITIPIFFLGAQGGFGPYGSYSLSLLGSSDISQQIISLHPPEEISLDFAHVDLFIGQNAPDLAWQPILNWLESHVGRGNGRSQSATP
jgi:hypothetical protein